MSQVPKSQEAEDSFLRDFCSIKRYPWGSIYLWAAEPTWPKFNFVRVTAQGADANDIKFFAKTFKDLSSYETDEIWFRISRSVKLAPDWQTALEKDPDAIVSAIYRNYPDIQIPNDPQFSLVRCMSEPQIRKWWEINSDGRSRSNIFDNSIWPIILKKFKQDTSLFYLLSHDEVEVTCGALDKFGDHLNSWGLATCAEHQQKGYSKVYLSEIAKRHPGELYCQVDEDGHRIMTLKRQSGTILLGTEDYYVYKHS